MDQATYQAAITNAKLKSFILQASKQAEKSIRSTPRRPSSSTARYPGAMEYDDFASVVAQAAAG